MPERFGGDRPPPGYSHPKEAPNLRRKRSDEKQERITKAPEWSPDAWKRQLIDAGLARPTVMSRRSFVLGSAALATAAAVDYAGKFTPLARWLDDTLVGQFDYDEVVKEAKQFLKERYDMDLVMGMEEDQDEVLVPLS